MTKLTGPSTDSPIDRQAIRQSFNHSAANYDAAAFLQREIADRLLSHLDCIRHQPTTVLDAGCGTGYSLPKLKTHFPESMVLGLDLAVDMLRRAQKNLTAAKTFTQKLRGFLMSPAPVPFPLICGDCAALPLPDQSLDLIFSNLTIQWLSDYPALFGEWFRATAANGLVIFSTFGPDTLHELRQAFQTVDQLPHVNQFTDLHDLGDALMETGFTDPVMEMEKITVTYGELKGLFHDLKRIGAHNLHIERSRGLMGKARWKKLLQAYEAFRQPEGLPATYEVIYGHAWKPAGRRAPPENTVISLDHLRKNIKTTHA